MSIQIAKITSKGQMTIPKAAREAVRLVEGDLVAVEVDGDRLLVRKLAGGRDPYLVGLEASLDEWASPEDEAAWRDL
jgi:antitoxin PrlF